MTVEKLRWKIDDAIEENSILKLQHIFAKNPDYISKKLSIGSEPWTYLAAKEGKVEILKYLFSLGIDINETGQTEGRTALNAACSRGQIKVVQYLLQHGATFDTQNAISNPLLDCVPGFVTDQHPVYGSDTPPEDYLKIAELLLDHGIDYSVRYNTETMKNMDAMAFACMWGRQDIARLIAERKASGVAEEVERLLAEAEQVAGDNTESVPEGEQVRPS